MMRILLSLVLSMSACLGLSGCCCTTPGGPYTGPGFDGAGHGCDPCGYGRGGITDVLFPLLSSRMACGSGCGILYWNEWLNDPPECTDPCDADGHWTGYSGAGSNCGHLVCGVGPGCQFDSLVRLFAAPWQNACTSCAGPVVGTGMAPTEHFCTNCLAARGAPTMGVPLVGATAPGSAPAMSAAQLASTASPAPMQMPSAAPAAARPNPATRPTVAAPRSSASTGVIPASATSNLLQRLSGATQTAGSPWAAPAAAAGPANRAPQGAQPLWQR